MCVVRCHAEQNIKVFFNTRKSMHGEYKIVNISKDIYKCLFRKRSSWCTEEHYFYLYSLFKALCKYKGLQSVSLGPLNLKYWFN